MPRHEAVDGLKMAIADVVQFTRRVQNFEQSGEERDARQKGDHHAAACDQTEFRNAAVVSRQESIKARGRRGGRQRQGLACISSGRDERLSKALAAITFVAVADGILNTEIDADADEQNSERN